VAIAAVVALGLARRPAHRENLHLAVEAAVLPVVGFAAVGVGWLFLWNAPLAAALFTLAVAGSVWMRGLNDDARVIGRAMALPFIAMLVAPPPTAGPLWLRIALALGAGLLALVVTAAMHAIGERAGIERPQAPPRSEPRSASGLTVHLRMALQLFVALGLAFLIGLTLFHAHWPWIVLTAFIVCAGALGRSDAVYKGALRLAGAIGGTLVGLIVARFAPSGGPLEAALMFLVLFIGLLLRDANYAYWAACTTTIFALLAGTHDEAATTLFGMRLLCILIGAVCGIAGAALVFPLNERDVVRKRLADALAAFESYPETPEASRAALDRDLLEVERMRPPLELLGLSSAPATTTSIPFIGFAPRARFARR
jgi:hypothetical protein